MPPATLPLDVEFARLAGEVAESFSFNKSLGQIFGMLYITGAPLSLGEIGARLSMSKGNVSLNVRLLESWGAVRPVSRAGSRQDFYEANRDLKAVAARRFQEGLSKRLDQAEHALDRLLADRRGEPEVKRVEALRSLAGKARRALKLASAWLS
jgi:DNA-binding transcriptional regulator GbsR (MarR family)